MDNVEVKINKLSVLIYLTWEYIDNWLSQRNLSDLP